MRIPDQHVLDLHRAAVGSRWVGWGEQRGYCGHLHESRDEAESCRALDSVRLQTRGSYSDRRVYRLGELDGEGSADIFQPESSTPLRRVKVR